MMKILLLCLVLSVSFVLAIFEGSDVQGGNHSFVVSLQSKQGNHFCCGALITLKFILTAASCVKDRGPNELMVIGGVTNLSDSSGTRMLVDKVISADVLGPRDIRNNIALLYLMEELPSSLNLHPIALANDDDHADKVGETCRIYGWGKRSKRTLEVSNTLQYAVTQIHNQTNCRKLYADENETLLCILDVKASLCLYDTGNPLISEQGHYLWGISTEIHWCGDTTNDSFYDVYTRVDGYRDWIQKNVNEHSASTQQKQAIFTGIIALLMTVLN